MKLTKKQIAAVITEAEKEIAGDEGVSTVAGILTTLKLLDCGAKIEERVTEIIVNELRRQDTIDLKNRGFCDRSMSYNLPDEEWPQEDSDGNHACKAGSYDDNIGYERCVLCDQPMGFNQWGE